MSPDTADEFVPARLYAEVQHFYANQMGLLDRGEVIGWAVTFTPDAVFEDATSPEPLRGRAAIQESVRERVDRLEAENRQFRHWFGMITVAERPDGELATRLYALAMSTPAGGPLTVHGHVVCTDRLVADGGTWSVRRRLVAPDGV